MAIRYFTVKNLAKFQHYKDRNPPWIKLYTKLIDDYEFNELPSATQRDLMMIWLLVSNEPEHKLPYNPKWIAQKIHARNPVDLDALSEAGFIIPESEALAPMLPKDASNLASKETSGTVAFPSVSLSSLDSSSLFSSPNSESSLDPNRSSETIVVHEPVIEPNEPTFEQFYAIYPRHLKKEAAAKAWKALSKSDRRSAMADVPLRLNGPWADQDYDFLPYPASYLNGKRWTDEFPPPRAGPAHDKPYFGNSGMAYLARNLGLTGNGSRRHDQDFDPNQGELVPATGGCPDGRNVEVDLGTAAPVAGRVVGGNPHDP